MPRRSVISCWKKSNTEERRLVSTASWNDMLIDIIEEFGLHPNTEIKLYMPDGLTPIKEKYFDRVLNDGLDVLFAHWNDEHHNVSLSLCQLDLPETPETSSASVSENKDSTQPNTSNKAPPRNKQFDIYASSDSMITCTLEYPSTSKSTTNASGTFDSVPTNSMADSMARPMERVLMSDADQTVIAVDPNSFNPCGSGNKTEGSLPIPYTVPQFPPGLEQLILVKREGIKLEERITNSIVKILREDMLKYLQDSLYPTMFDYKTVCESLIRKYPFLADDSASGTGIALWRNKLRRSFRTMRGSKPDTPQSLEKKMIYTNSNSVTQEKKTVNSPAVKKNPRPEKKLTDPIQILQGLHRIVRDHDGLRAEMESILQHDQPNYDRIREILVNLRPYRQKVFREAENLLEEFNAWPALKIPSLLYGEVLSEIGSAISPNDFPYKVSALLQELLPTFVMKLKRSAQFQEILNRYQDHELLSLYALSCILREDLRFFLVEAGTSLTEVSREIIIQVNEQSGSLSYNILFDRAIILENIFSATQALCTVFCLHFVLNLSFSSPKVFEVIHYCLTGQRAKNMSAKTFITKFSLEKLK